MITTRAFLQASPLRLAAALAGALLACTAAQAHQVVLTVNGEPIHDASYRVSANFLNYVSEHYDKDLVKKLNAALRQGKYSEDLWKQYTGKTAPELAEEWKQSLEKGK